MQQTLTHDKGRSGWPSFAAMCAFVLSCVPVLAWYVRRAMDRSDEPFGIIALGAAIVTLVASAHYTQRDGTHLKIHPHRLWIAAAIIFCVQITGMVRWPLALGLMMVAGIACSVTMPRAKAGWVMLLVLSLPLIATLDFYAGYPMRWVAAQISYGLLSLAGVAVERAGVVLMDDGRIVGIDPPCAGIRMLWSACFVAAVFATRMRLSWPRTLLLAGLAVTCVAVGNGVRAAIVFLPESGRVVWPDWAHPGTGLMIHAGVLAAVSSAGSRFSRVESGRMEQLAARMGVAAVLLMGITTIALPRTFGSHANDLTHSAPWPASMDGVPLLAQPLSDVERSFARSFPGDVGRFACGASEVILRRAHQPTRMMHPATHCLRAAGFKTDAKPLFVDADGEVWGHFLASRDGTTFQVFERYVNASESAAATDVSAWFWQAMANPDQGPWTAVTRIERLPD
jgi:exosortase/archaeosortase family protein